MGITVVNNFCLISFEDYPRMDFYAPVGEQLHKALVGKLGSLNFGRHGGDLA